MFKRFAASIAAGVLVVTGLAAGTAHADETPTVTPTVECGKVTLQFSNPTDFLFVFDYRVDRERPKHGPVVEGAIKEGPLAGKPFGPRWNLVPVDGRKGQHSHSVTLSFPEDSGVHRVTYRLAEGGEQKMFFDWQKPVVVKTDCRPNPVRPGTPTAADPACDTQHGTLTIPAQRGVRYEMRRGSNPYRAVRAGEHQVRPGVYWVRAVARDGYRLVGRDGWRLVVKRAEACPTPTPTPTDDATDEPTVSPSPTVEPSQPSTPPAEEPTPTETSVPVPTVTETVTQRTVVERYLPTRVDTGLGGTAK